MPKKTDTPIKVDKNGNLDYKAYRSELYALVDKRRAASKSSTSPTPPAKQVQRGK